MKTRVFRTLCSLACLLLHAGAIAVAEEKAPSAPTPLEQIPNELDEMDKPILEKTSVLLGVIESEFSANRLPESMAQQLRLAIATIRPQVDGTLPMILRASSLSSFNQPLLKAAADLEAAWDLASARRVELLQQAVSQAQERVSAIANSAKSAGDIDPLLHTLLRLDASTPNKFGNSSHKFAKPIHFLRILRESFDPLLMDGGVMESRVLGALRSEDTENSKPRLDVRHSRAEEKVKLARQALDAALLARASSEKVQAALDAYRAASDGVSAFKFFAAESLRAYMQLCDIPALIENHQWSEAATVIQGTGYVLGELGPEREPGFRELLNEQTAVIAKEQQHEKLRRETQWRSRIDEAKSPEDLEALAAEIRSIAAREHANEDASFPTKLPEALAAAASEWRYPMSQPAATPRPSVRIHASDRVRISEGIVTLAEPPFEEGMGNAAAFSRELTNLHHHITTQIWSRALKAPELNQPPLVDLPLDFALEHLRQQLTAGRDWPRLFQFLTNFNRFPPLGIKNPPLANQGAFTVIRWYLAAQNFELAEDWPTAAAAYQFVINAKLDGTPVQESESHLAALLDRHPELKHPPEKK